MTKNLAFVVMIVTAVPGRAQTFVARPLPIIGAAGGAVSASALATPLVPSALPSSALLAAPLAAAPALSAALPAAAAGPEATAPRRRFPRGLGQAETLAKISVDATLGEDELKVVFPAETTPAQARAVFADLELMAWLSPAAADAALLPSPDGGGLYAVFAPVASDDAGRAMARQHAVIAGYALARRFETRGVSLGSGLKRALDDLSK